MITKPSPIKALSKTSLSEFLVTQGWLSLSRLQKLESITDGDVTRMTDTIIANDRDLINELSIAVNDWISGKSITDDLQSKTITLLQEGEGRLDHLVDGRYTQTLRISEVKEDSLQTNTVFDADLTPGIDDFCAEDTQGELIASRYMFISRLGEGGMCYVDKVFDSHLGREVALKYPKNNTIFNHSNSSASFEIEARIIGRLQHPNVLPVYDYLSLGMGDLQAYTMRISDSSSLDLLTRGSSQLPHSKICQILKQVALALETAHLQGVVHRDVKPHNILVGSGGEVYLTDWGICKLSKSHPDARLLEMNNHRSLAGTPAFMSPEQTECDIELITPLTDVYGLGATLYYTLVGKPPFQGSGLVEILKKISEHNIIPPNHAAAQEGRQSVPQALNEICLKAMAKFPSDRYQSAREFADAIELYLSGETERERKLINLHETMNRGHQACQKYKSLREKKLELEQKIIELSKKIGAPTEKDDVQSIQAKRRPMWRLEEHLDQLLKPIEESFTQSTTEYLTALNLASEADSNLGPLISEARDSLSDLLWERLLEAEIQGDSKEETHLKERLRAVANTQTLEKLEGRCQLNLSGLIDGITVEIYQEQLQRYQVSSNLIERFITPRDTPLFLLPGTYLVKLSLNGAAPCRAHLKLNRGASFHFQPRLIRESELPPNAVYIPDINGGLGLVIMQYLVRYRDYVAFLNELGESAENRAPRYGNTIYAERSSNGQFVECFTDPEGDQWSPDWPIMLINCFDVIAYADWRAQKDKLPWRLPTIEEWRKAAQGADGRPYPWGLQFDAALCLMRDSTHGRVTPLPVGSIDTDVSPYGLFDVAGNVCQWTSSLVEGESEIHRIVGSSFNSVAATCHLDTELSSPAKDCLMHVGARLVFTPRLDQLI